MGRLRLVPQKTAGILREAELTQILAEERLCDVSHGAACVHRRLLDPPMSLRLRESKPLDEHCLGPVHQLSRFQPPLQVAVLLANGFEVPEPGHGEIEGRPELFRAQRLHQKSENTRLDGSSGYVGTRSTSEQDEGARARGHDFPGGLHSVTVGEADGDHRDVRAMHLDQVHGILDVASVAHYLPALSGDRFTHGCTRGSVIVDD